MRLAKDLSSKEKPVLILRLFISGITPNSIRALQNMKAFVKNHLHDQNVDLEIIDIYQMPGLASQYQIIAAPTLIRIFPEPERRFIGDLSETDRLIEGLSIARYED